MLEPDTVPLGFSGVQALQLIAWDGRSSSKEFDQLVASIQVKLDINEVSAESDKSSGAKKSKRSPVFHYLVLLIGAIENSNNNSVVLRKSGHF